MGRSGFETDRRSLASEDGTRIERLDFDRPGVARDLSRPPAPRPGVPRAFGLLRPSGGRLWPVLARSIGHAVPRQPARRRPGSPRTRRRSRTRSRARRASSPPNATSNDSLWTRSQGPSHLLSTADRAGGAGSECYAGQHDDGFAARCGCFADRPGADAATDGVPARGDVPRCTRDDRLVRGGARRRAPGRRGRSGPSVADPRRRSDAAYGLLRAPGASESGAPRRSSFSPCRQPPSCCWPSLSCGRSAACSDDRSRVPFGAHSWDGMGGGRAPGGVTSGSRPGGGPEWIVRPWSTSAP